MLGWIPAPAADLTKIPRTIAKEPAYRTTSPQYCLVVFGPEAKDRVWLVLDGDVLYADRNSNGDLTEPTEQFPFEQHACCRIGNVLADGVAYKDVRVFQDSRGMHVGAEVPGRGRQSAGSDLHGRLTFALGPEAAPIVHLGGPLQISLDSFPHINSRDFIHLHAVVGTPGQGNGTFAAINPDDMFKGAKFTADATFMPTGATAKPERLLFDFDCY
jgi:hypothetical protein